MELRVKHDVEIGQAVYRVVVTPDSEKVAVASEDKTVKLIDIESGEMSSVISTNRDERNPLFLPEDSSLLHISYKDGFPSLYKNSKSLNRSTSGVFNPFYDPNKGAVGYIGFSGFKRISPFLVFSSNSNEARRFFEDSSKNDWRKTKPVPH